MRLPFATKKRWSLYSVLLLLIIMATAFIFQFSSKWREINATLPNLVTATILPKPRDITQFRLTDNQNQPFTNKNLLGHWTFMFFGFTSCPNICPTTMSELNKIYAILQNKNQTLPQFVLISIDPQRDTLDRINTYVTAFNKDFIGATGSDAQIQNLTKNLNVLYMKIYPRTEKEALSYELDHSGTIMLFNPQGKLAAFFSMPHDAAVIAKDFEEISHG